MKWLLLLFSLYVIILSGIPCDCQEDDFMYATATSADSHNNHHDGEHQQQDCPCSPFFACSTCHGVVIPDGSIKIIKPVYVDKQVFYPYKENAVIQYPFSIFQPPQLT
ncbi:DUF6660 family protein [Chitinophaga sp. 30R24]|uniref:DUF6660 family protein n=1 Tax=Chitinophaga sp. 30R24 TaxID=3248838 RepID=UPI003B912E20